MTPPGVLPLSIIAGLEGSYGILHGPVGGHPLGDIGEVRGDVPVLDRITEADRAPERLDVTEHLATEGPDTGHPVAVPAPKQIVADKSVVLVAGEIDPLGGAVGGEFPNPCNSRVEQNLRNPDLDEDQDGRRLDHEAELVAEGPQHLSLGIGECASLPAPQQSVCETENMEEDQLGHHGSSDTDPAVQPCSRDPGNPGEEADKEVEPGCLGDPVVQGVGKTREKCCDAKTAKDDEGGMKEWGEERHVGMMRRRPDQSNENREKLVFFSKWGFLSCAHGRDGCSLAVIS